MWEDEVDKDDIRRTGVVLRVPHANCKSTYEVELDWPTLLNIYHLKPARVEGAATQLIPPGGLPEFMRIAFRCQQCWAHYQDPRYDRDRNDLTTAKLDVTPQQALELLRAGKARGYLR